MESMKVLAHSVLPIADPEMLAIPEACEDSSIAVANHFSTTSAASTPMRSTSTLREIINKVERAVTLAEEGSELTIDLFSVPASPNTHRKRSLREELESLERERIYQALEETRWVKAEAARLLRITRTTFNSRLGRLGIPMDPPEETRSS
jgi:transcriptional regulator with AAA-type ATPase domain